MFIVETIRQPSEDTIMMFETIDCIISFLRCRHRGDTAVFSTPRKQKFSRNFVGGGTFDAPVTRRPPPLKISHKQIDSGTNDVRTELYGCSLKPKIFANQFFDPYKKPNGRNICHEIASKYLSRFCAK